MNILHIVKVKILMLIKIHPLMFTIESKIVSIFQARSPIPFKRISFEHAFLTTYYSHIGLQIIAIFYLGMCTLPNAFRGEVMMD